MGVISGMVISGMMISGMMMIGIMTIGDDDNDCDDDRDNWEDDYVYFFDRLRNTHFYANAKK